MSKVYMVQMPHRWDGSRQELVPKFDTESAKQYGELVQILGPTAAPFKSKPIVDEIFLKLKNIQPEDSVLLIGNPILIGIVTAIAADLLHPEPVRLLQWSGKDGKYIPVEVNIFGS